MSEVYNPESEAFKELESLELEARELAKNLEEAKSPEEKKVIERQLEEAAKRVELLKRKLKP